MVERMRRRTLLKSLLLVGLVAGLAACGDGALEPLPLGITIQASPATAAPGETITFVVTAQGEALLGVDVDYGDGGTGQYPTGGARTARVTFGHAYSAAGTYTVRAAVTDAVAGTKEAGVEVRVE